MRTLHINEQAWKYTIGRTGVKVVSPDGKGSFHKHSEVFGWPEADIEAAKKAWVFKVTPQIVKDFLMGIKQPPLKLNELECESCGSRDGTVHATVDPFDNEIHQKHTYGIWCENCLDRRAADI